jgi:hypothetical protein
LFACRYAEAQEFGRNKVRYDRLEFRVLRTEHFDIYYYPEEEEATRFAARMAERWYARYSKHLRHTFSHRQPLVLYSSHPHFSQTNVTADSPGEGTGGLTERNKARIAMPFAAGLGETDHVLGHEIAHAFQIDISRQNGQNAFSLPGWFIEGMAESLSLGPIDVQTSMWIRDAAIYGQLPTLAQLKDPRFFPYRYGHALWSYLATEYGEDKVVEILKSTLSDPIKRLEAATHTPAEELTRDWHATISKSVAGRPPGVSRPRVILSSRDDDARLHVGPSLSPDGRRLMFLSERDRLSLDLFLADTATGTVKSKVLSTALDPHLDSLQYIHSSGAWDTSGRRFAMTAISAGGAMLIIVDPNRPEARTEVKLEGIGEAYNPSWSPDGSRIVFSGMKGGLSDLFIYRVADKSVTQLTADAYADLQPAWAPDGRTIALVTDRFTSDFDMLGFGALRVGLLDVDTGTIREAYEDERATKQVSPQWTPDGQSLFFISDRGGVSNVFRLELDTHDLRQVTFVTGGVSGITASSPALAVAADAGTLAFSVYRNGRYEIESLDAARAANGAPVAAVQPAGPAAEPGQGSLQAMLGDASFGLPSGAAFSVAPYDDSLHVESWSQPYVGAAAGSGAGGLLQATFGFTLGDTLRDRQVGATFRAGTAKDDFAAQVAYLSRKGQWSWGAATGFAPSRFVGARRALFKNGETNTRETTHLHYSNQWVSLISRYDVSRVTRFEFRGGIRRTGFEWETVSRVLEAATGDTVSRGVHDTPAGDPVYVAEGQVAFVRDTSISGPTSPILGERYRVEVEPAVGGLAYANVRLDARRYMMPIRPVTLAVRVQHTGRYGPGAGDPRLTPLLLGLQSMVRGYDMTRYAADECGRTALSCSLVDELAGSRFGVMNVELRAPVMGLLTGDLDYGRLPVEAIAFADGAFLWTNAANRTDRDRFRSVGAGARINMGGLVFEATAAHRFDGGDRGWTANLLIRRGF